jgi:hypothetical protein
VGVIVIGAAGFLLTLLAGNGPRSAKTVLTEVGP